MLFFGLVLLVFGSLCQADTLLARVVGVTDGDTVTVLDAGNREEKIRVGGIDAPEKRQAFGEKSKQSLASLVFGKDVRIEWKKRDRYGRIVGQVIVEPSVDAGLAQLRSGLAWHYKKYEGEQSPEDRLSYAKAEDEARASKTGLWSDTAPVPPWEFRHK